MTSWSAPRGIFHPKPGSAEETRSLAGFTVGDKVVCVNLPATVEFHYIWTTHGRRRANKVGEIIHVNVDRQLFLVCHEKAEYINLKADQLRKATQAELKVDAQLRRKREERLRALVEE